MEMRTFPADDADVTDTSGAASRPRTWQAVLAAATTVLSAGVVTAVVQLRDPAAADTFVTSVTRAVVDLPDGSSHAAHLGDRLPRGATLRTGQDGGARLTTAGRDVYVGALSTVSVQDGVHETLERGQVMVDTRSGPRLALATKAGTVTTPGGSLARVERGAVLRLGVFRGSSVLAAQGRQTRAAVSAYHQVITQYGAVPGRPTALTLTGDRWEQTLAADLVASDQQLERLRAGLRGAEGRLVLQDAAFRAPSVGDQGEAALSTVLAQVATRSASVTDNLATIVAARAEGGSWGPVAAIVRASADAVSARLDRDLGPAPVTTPVLAGPVATLPPVLVTTSSTPQPVVTGQVPTTTPPTTPVTSPPVEPPPPSSSTVVDQVLKIVTDLVPLPTPSPTRTPSAPAVPKAPVPAPSPSPLLQVGPVKVG